MSDMRATGSIARALLWVVVGLLGAVVVFVAVSPELAGSDPGRLLAPIGLVSVAAIPGMILLGVAAVRRARLGPDHHADGNR